MEPKKINYIYGGNGTGKTTLSRFFMSPSAYAKSSMEFESPDCDLLVYNKNFVENNFSDKAAIRGIFTIGEESKEIEEKIEEKVKEKQKLDERVNNLETSINKISDDAKTEKTNFEDICWQVRKSNEAFRECFVGVMDAKEKFANKCKEHKTSVKCTDTLESLKDSYEILFKTTLTAFEEIANISYASIADFENASILNTSIVGKDDIPMSKLIETLNNSDWTKTGLAYLKESNNICPFCQQSISNNIKQALLEVFDESFEKQCNDFENVKVSYIDATSVLITKIEAQIQRAIPILNFQKINELKNDLEKIVERNIVRLNEKSKSPSIKVQLETIIPFLENIKLEIEELNKKIKTNNELVKNQVKEKESLIKSVWNIVANNLLFDNIEAHINKINGINAGTQRMKMEQSSIRQQIQQIETDVNSLQAQTSSIDYAISEINKLLKNFSFTSFSFVKCADNRNYKIVREDGSDVKETLSEGEHRFITFLYFYQLLKGNIEQRRSMKNKVVVIDDPISSLDSNILFIVSTLVKEIIADCLAERNLFKQVFVLTHNIYFHQEVAFKSARENRSPLKERFWVIKRNNNESIFLGSDESKIKTSYELLWQEVKDPTYSNSATIFNTLRRILEYYFKIIGDIDYEKCINEMEKEDMLICKSLLSFINDGSHTISDDFVVCYDADAIKKYLEVFKKVFEKTNQVAHYEMMMKRNY